MIDNLNEINRILVAIDKLNRGEKGALESSVDRFCRGMVIEGRFPDHQATIRFSIESGIITKSGNRLLTTLHGKKLLELNPQLKYDLNEGQKEFFVKNCLLDGKLAPHIEAVLRQFSPAYSKGTYQWYATDNAPMSGDQSIIEVMRQSGLINETNGRLVVNQKYVLLVRNLWKPPAIFTTDELAIKLREAEVIGAIAEDLALDFERKRLQDMGCSLESECIQKISELNVAAGYDIMSFDGPNTILAHDRFIEVKGSTGNKISFFWSKNEVDQAISLGERYWIYFIGGIDKENKTSSTEPILIQDPVKNVLQNSDFQIESEQYLIKKKE